MNHQLQMNDGEWALVLEVLQAERRELPAEIHHTDSPTVHDELHDRLKMVDGLIERLQKQDQGVH